MNNDTAARPLGFVETALALNDSYRPMNATAALQITGPLEPAALRRALDHLQARHPGLRARLVRKRRPAFQYGDVAAIPLEVVERDLPDTWVGVAEKALGTFIPMDGDSAMRVTMVGREGSGDGEIVVTINHTVLDATSLANVLHEIVYVYSAAVSGEKLPLDEVLEPPPPVDSLFPEDLEGWRLHARRARLLGRSMAAEARYRPAMRRHGAFRVQPEFSLQILPGELDADTTARLSRRVRSRRLTMNSVVQAAMMLAVYREFYDGASVPLRTFGFADLRPYLGGGLPPEPLAAYMAMTWHDVTLDPSADLWSVAETVQGLVYEAVRKGGKFVASATTAPMMRMTLTAKKFRMGNTALSFTGTAPLGTDYGAVQLRGMHGFLSNMGLGPEWAMWGGQFHGRLMLDAITLDRDMSREQMAKVGGELRRMLTEAAGVG